MTFIRKPKIALPGQKKNELGLLLRDYEGSMSTLCAGCGHDSITAALVQALWEMSIAPEQLIKLSGIGCSSKTPAYFVHGAHGFNSVHGRMPSVATGATVANRDLICIGISGDGDSLSIGFGQYAHAIRRNLNMLYMIENNGVYGLTKGQFSAAADPGSAIFGLRMKVLRIRAYPFGQEVVDFLHTHETVFVVEQNRDAQMKSLLMLEINNVADRLVSILHYNGMPIPNECVVRGISEHLKSEAVA